MNRSTTYACEACGAPAGPSGIRCDPCHRWTLQQLLDSPEWVEVALTRKGTVPGETLAHSIRREHACIAASSGLAK